MIRLEDLKRGDRIKGIISNSSVTVVDILWHGSSAIDLTYKDAEGKPGNELIYRDRESTLEIEQPGSRSVFCWPMIWAPEKPLWPVY